MAVDGAGLASLFRGVARLAVGHHVGQETDWIGERLFRRLKPNYARRQREEYRRYREGVSWFLSPRPDWLQSRQLCRIGGMHGLTEIIADILRKVGERWVIVIGNRFERQQRVELVAIDNRTGGKHLRQGYFGFSQ